MNREKKQSVLDTPDEVFPFTQPQLAQKELPPGTARMGLSKEWWGSGLLFPVSSCYGSEVGAGRPASRSAIAQSRTPIAKC